MTDDGSIPAVDELLGLLGNETRMAIVRVLWEAFDFEAYVTESREGTSYSTLLDAAPTDDSGNLNYHLRQLDGVLVHGRDDGYVLTPLGYNLMSSIDRYDSFSYDTIDERTVADPCPYCGGDLVAEYSREIVSVRCQDCGGLASGGNFTFVEVSAAGGTELSLPALLDAATLAMMAKIRSSSHGVCWDCRTPMDRSVELCDDHDQERDGVCSVCDLRYRSTVQARCPHCGTGGQGPLLEYAVVTPTVAAFHERHGRGPTQVGPWRYRLAAFEAATETVRDTDPVAVDLTFDRGGDTCRVTVDAGADGPVFRRSTGTDESG